MNPIAVSFLQSLQRHQQLFASLAQYQAAALQLFSAVSDTLQQGGKVVFLGNGGSAADSQHLAAELMVRYRAERGPLAAIALTTDTSILTAHANDYHFDTVFERQILALVSAKDTVIGLTTSGNSRNVNLALQAANALGAYTVALTGGSGGEAKHIARLALTVDHNETARIQEVHMFIGHWLCEALDSVYSRCYA